MNTPLIDVQLAAPVKLGGKWHKPGDVLIVTSAEAEALRASGALVESIGDPTEAAPSMPGFDETAKVLAGAGIEAAVDTAMAGADKALAAMEARALEAEAQRDLLQERVIELQAEIEQLGTATAENGTADKMPAGEAKSKATSAKGAKSKG